MWLGLLSAVSMRSLMSGSFLKPIFLTFLSVSAMISM